MIPFPDIHIYQFNTSEIADPSGTRHIEGGSFAFVKRVGLNCGDYSGAGTSGILDFGRIRINTAAPSDPIASDVIALIIRLASSGVGIANMRLYLTDQTALTRPALDVGKPSPFVQMIPSGIWQPNPTLPSGAATRLTNIIGKTANFNRQDGKSYIAASEDRDVSQYIYMNMIIPYGFPLGAFGSCGSGLLRFGIAFDYFKSDEFLRFGEP